MKDLVLLVPDKNVQFGIDSLFSRYNSLEIRQISYEIYVHPLHDPGIFSGAASFLRPFSKQYLYALAFVDHEGSGKEQILPSELSRILKNDIERNGWPNRVEVIVFYPEFEIWIWTEDDSTAKSLGWGNYLEMKNWLLGQGVWEQNLSKPKRPKEAVEISLKIKHIPRSSSIYREIGQKARLDRCQDQSFRSLKNILQNWFPK